ncbi:MAG: flagellar basal body P-ring protein FlgI [Gemmatimonadetes bacterium]|nr:flagellar basal body P-ring protein FlgI [Gemmatimonadota bacterium]MCC6773818.1 flagellar basal body P-ring protein FlgI [Gemmatimonadaceae bacterium]
MTASRRVRRRVAGFAGFAGCVVLAASCLGTQAAHAQGVPIRDLVIDDQGVPVRLVGYGLVTGLSGTGDNTNSARGSQQTVQSVANLLRRFDVIVPAEFLRTRNVAAVLVTAEVSPYLRPGGRFEVQVASVGDARSLRGGVLWMTPLIAEVGGQPLASAQGPLYVDEQDAVRRRIGFNATSSRIAGGGVIEADLPRPQFAASTRLILREPDIGLASRIAAVIDSVVGEGTAKVEDPGAITLAARDSGGGGPAATLARIRDLKIEVARVARIVIDQRQGTIVAGGDLTLGPGVVSIQGLTLSIGPAPADTAQQGPGGQVRVPTGATVQQLAAALSAVRTPAHQVAQIFEALKQVGAISAEVVAR